MSKNLTGVLLILLAVLGGVGELLGWLLPTVSWPFTVSRDLSLLSLPGEVCPLLEVEGRVHWFGWFFVAGGIAAGLYLLLRKRGGMRLSPHMAERVRRFYSIRRGRWSMRVLMLILLMAALDQCLVGKRALAVCSEAGEWYFPAFCRKVIPGSEFGFKGNEAKAETNYRRLKEMAGKPGGPKLVLMPLVPYAPVMDAAAFPTEQLTVRDGVIYEPDGRRTFNGLACRLYPDGSVHVRMRCRRGVPDGQVQGWDKARREVYLASYTKGVLKQEVYKGKGTVRGFLAASPSDRYYLVHYHPAPPMTGGHLLGTNSQGADILAYLYGGLQVNIKAALFYLPAVFGIGILLGLLMGYYGGGFDIFTQRLIEIFSQVPFLFVVMILSEFIPMQMRGAYLVLSLLSLFGWMHISTLVRTATLKEKTRDYVAAARVMGAGPFHIMRLHILPNISGIIVTMLPFAFAAVVLSLASLDYLGFGLPDTSPSWGRLLNDGLSKLSSPWIVSSAFAALVILLLLITFIGEAAREAVDPRRRTYYD